MWYSKQFLCEMINDLYIYDENVKKINEIVNYYDHNSEIKKVFLDITNKCNIKCRHCFTNSNNIYNTKELNTSDVKKIIDELVELKISRLALGGGEPLVRSDIYELIHYANNRDIRIHISSNGLLLTEANVKKLKECGLDSIQISIDSSNAIQHDYLRCSPGLFDKCLKAIDFIKKHEIKLLVSTTITKLNIDELEDIAKMIKSKGVKLHRFIRFVPVGRGNTNKNMLYVEGKLLLNKIKNLRKKYSDYFVGNLSNNFGIPTKTYNVKVDGDNPVGCEAGKISIDILSNGNVVPCNYLGTDKKWICGNVINDTLENIIKNSPILKKFKQLSGKDIKACQDCILKNACGKGCRAVAYNLNGTIDSLDLCCKNI